MRLNAYGYHSVISSLSENTIGLKLVLTKNVTVKLKPTISPNKLIYEQKLFLKFKQFIDFQ